MSSIELWRELIAGQYAQAACGLLADAFWELATEPLRGRSRKAAAEAKAAAAEMVGDAGDGRRVAEFLATYQRDRHEFAELCREHVEAVMGPDRG
jgi:hypothetical protein